MLASDDNDNLVTVELSEADLPLCLSLSAAAGWNQTEADWRFQIAMGEGIGLKNSDGQLVATGVNLPVTREAGWIAMVLVDESWRRRGLGRTIMQTLIGRSVVPHLALDATAQGRGLYESLGFKTIERITRYWKDRGGGEVACSDLPAPESEDVTSFFGGVAAALARRTDVKMIGSEVARALVRPGRSSLQIGPVVAHSESEAIGLVSSALDGSTGDVIIDVPLRLGSFSRRVERLGFTEDRAFDRMSRGGAYFVDAGTFAIAGPEYS